MGRPNFNCSDFVSFPRSRELSLAGRFQLVRTAGATIVGWWDYKPVYFSANFRCGTNLPGGRTKKRSLKDFLNGPRFVLAHLKV
jgi:hypothetical protein